MNVQLKANMFGAERARRYKGAMDRCPVARYLEILPLLCLVATTRLQCVDIIDLGSGTGYLADLVEDSAASVLRVDKSAEMLKQSGSANILVSDMCAASTAIGEEKADIITCLASFHHVHIPEIPDLQRTYIRSGTRVWGPERHLDIVRSIQVQYDAVRDWTRILRPGGWLYLIDVPGHPDDAWQQYWPNQTRHAINTRGYHADLLDRLAEWRLETDCDALKSLFKGPWESFFNQDPHMRCVITLLQKRPTLRDLVESYEVPNDVLKVSGPMVPADFFDDVIDGYGAQRHFAFFPRETSIGEALAGAGMTAVQTATLPTPWLFEDEREAAWFVHELFGLGAEWHFDSIPEFELNEMIKWLDKYLGFYRDKFGRTMLYWQLAYFVAQKPDHDQQRTT